jgi:hypothetical protein
LLLCNNYAENYSNLKGFSVKLLSPEQHLPSVQPLKACRQPVTCGKNPLIGCFCPDKAGSEQPDEGGQYHERKREQE